MHKWQQVKALKAQGKSNKEIVRQPKLSKNTVKKYLRTAEPPHFKAREYEKLLKQYAGNRYQAKNPKARPATGVSFETKDVRS